jgi:hypothetical protein
MHEMNADSQRAMRPRAGAVLGRLAVPTGVLAAVAGAFAAALQDNALAVTGYVLFAAVWTVWVVRAVRGRPFRIDLGPAQLWAAGTLLLVFTLVRNLPFGGWLHP